MSDFGADDEDITNALNTARFSAGADPIQQKIGGLNQFLTGFDLEANVPQFHTGLPQTPLPTIGGAGYNQNLINSAKLLNKNDFIEKHSVEINDPVNATHSEMELMAQKQNNMPAHYIFNLDKIDPFEMDHWDEPISTRSQEQVNSLKNSIINNEKIPPVLVEGSPFDKKYRPMVVDGHHRTIAYKELGIKEIPAFLTNKTLSNFWDQINNSNFKRGGSVSSLNINHALRLADAYDQ